MPTIISAKNLSFSYDKDKTVLDAISFDIQQGDFIGIIGANGWGKSTLLKLILGFLKPQEGEINIASQWKKNPPQSSFNKRWNEKKDDDVTQSESEESNKSCMDSSALPQNDEMWKEPNNSPSSCPAKRGERKRGSGGDSSSWNSEYLSIWYIPQFSSLTQNFPISVRELIQSGNIQWHNFLKTPPWDDHTIDELLKQFHLTTIADKLISEVSGGERQRALIARALVKNPDIIIADEPTSNIDIHREKEVFSVFEQLHKMGKTLIVVSHDIFLLKKYASIVFDVNKHLHTHKPEEITEKLIYESYICPDCHHQH